MCRCQPSAHQRALRTVQRHHFRSWRIAERLVHPHQQSRSDPVCAQHSTFDAKKREFVIRIDLAQHPVELQAVDHDRRIEQTDVLGPQVPVPLAHVTFLSARADRAGMPRKRAVELRKHCGRLGLAETRI